MLPRRVRLSFVLEHVEGGDQPGPCLAGLDHIIEVTDRLPGINHQSVELYIREIRKLIHQGLGAIIVGSDPIPSFLFSDEDQTYYDHNDLDDDAFSI